MVRNISSCIKIHEVGDLKQLPQQLTKQADRKIKKNTEYVNMIKLLT